MTIRLRDERGRIRPERPMVRCMRLVNIAGPISEARPELGPCWVWLGRVKRNGYGTFFPSRRECWNVHRWVYTQLVGPILKGMEIDHLCRNRACVNPDHLESVPPATNTQRAQALKTHCPHGHPYDEANTAWWGGYRNCRACNAEQCADYQARKAAAVFVAKVEHSSKGRVTRPATN